MGLYVFKIDVLQDLLRSHYPTSNDFRSEIIPMAAEEFNVQHPKFHFFDPQKPIFTSPRFLSQTKIEKSQILNSIISHGCFLRDCHVEHFIVGVRSRLEYGVEINDTMMMGSDYYQTEAEIASIPGERIVPMGVGTKTKISNCIIDKNAKIGKNVIIVNQDKVEEAERPSEGFYIRSDITVVLKNSTILDGTII
ncbi:hypothetical protein GIB67_000877 [Kingdonia uniflora]|uniref:Glucose-1-phosphate adenylyltransferase n=1 Tax=Kingdonia uniflora TaxID=39325 RepID=A0A7J7LFR7_9MAGN|nr:hypothetical protein GIB67_000877 [Kingdonia uniflora]